MSLSAHDRDELRMRAAARAELERRELIRKLEGYITYCDPNLVVSEPLAPVYRLWDRIRQGEQVHALISGPPRTRKTTNCFYGAVRELEFNPKTMFGYGTYSTEAARQQSIRCRSLAEDAGIWVSDEQMVGESRFGMSKSMSYWATAQGGGGKFIGRGGAAIGAGFNTLLIDDPIKNWDDASAPNTLDKTWVWTVSMMGRMEPKASFILAHHRWAKLDPIGRMESLIDSKYDDLPDELLDGIGGDLDDVKWDRIVLPACGTKKNSKGDVIPDFAKPLLTEDGDRWFSPIELARRYVASPEQFAAQWLQDPSQVGGVMFPPAWANWEPLYVDGERGGIVVADEWLPVPEVPPHAILGFSADTAGSVSSSADWTALVLAYYWWEWSTDLQIYEPWMDIVGAWFERLQSPDVVDFIAKKVRSVPGAFCAYEEKSEGKAQLAFLKRDYPDIPVHGVKAAQSKRQRCVPLAAAAKRGRCRTPLRAGWLKEWYRQCTAFTGAQTGKDDLPDAGAHGFNFFSETMPPPRKRVGGARKMVTEPGYRGGSRGGY